MKTQKMKDIPNEWFSSKYYLEKGYNTALEQLAGIEQIRLDEEGQLIRNLDIVRHN